MGTKEKGKKGKLTISRTTFCLRISGQRHRCYMVSAQPPAADQYRCQCTCCRKVVGAAKVVAIRVAVVRAAQVPVIEIVLNPRQAAVRSPLLRGALSEHTRAVSF